MRGRRARRCLPGRTAYHLLRRWPSTDEEIVASSPGVPGRRDDFVGRGGPTCNRVCHQRGSARPERISGKRTTVAISEGERQHALPIDTTCCFPRLPVEPARACQTTNHILLATPHRPPPPQAAEDTELPCKAVLQSSAPAEARASLLARFCLAPCVEIGTLAREFRLFVAFVQKDMARMVRGQPANARTPCVFSLSPHTHYPPTIHHPLLPSFRAPSHPAGVSGG